MLAQVEALMSKGEAKLTAEETRLLEMLGILLADYEDRAHPLPKGDPSKMLAHLMQENETTAAALSAIIPRSRISEILAGKRAISKAQAKKLAEFFRVPVDLLI